MFITALSLMCPIGNSERFITGGEVFPKDFSEEARFVRFS